MKEAIFNETNVHDLVQGITERAVADYRKAIYLLSRCKSRKCSSCSKPLGEPCESALKSVKDFFDGDIFYLAYPNVDGSYVAKQAEIIAYECINKKETRGRRPAKVDGKRNYQSA